MESNTHQATREQTYTPVRTRAHTHTQAHTDAHQAAGHTKQASVGERVGCVLTEQGRTDGERERLIGGSAGNWQSIKRTLACGRERNVDTHSRPRTRGQQRARVSEGIVSPEWTASNPAGCARWADHCVEAALASQPRAWCRSAIGSETLAPPAEGAARTEELPLGSGREVVQGVGTWARASVRVMCGCVIAHTHTQT